MVGGTGSSGAAPPASAAAWLCSLLQKMDFPMEFSLSQASKSLLSSPLPAAAVGVLLNPNELCGVWGHGCAPRVCPCSQDPGSEDIRMDRKVLGWLCCVGVREKFRSLL